ncbi:hypothetical protein [Burkholderia anthina]|uniref:hypothetical protein n=1 Tax=Burkholderia anthina TaxID=179879 RepID=UPI00158E1BEA|nr:hypothetical protein [Burkholderia anthina]
MTTTDKRRADALTDDEREVLEHAAGFLHTKAATALRKLLAASPVEQHEAAPWRGACEHTTANTACRICREKHGENYDQRATQPAPSAPLEGTGNGAAFHLCTPKTGGEGYVIERAPDSFELRDCEVIALQADEKSAFALVRKAILAANRGGDIDICALIAADNILSVFASRAPRTEVVGAVLSGDARECLMDVVSHHGDFVLACEHARDDASDADSAAYMQKQIDALDRMKVQAERALAEPSADAAAAPADEPSQVRVTHTIATEDNAATILHGLLDSFVEVAAAFPRAVIDERLAGQARLYLPAAAAGQEAVEPVAWRYLTPTGWHATTDLSKVVRVSVHHEVIPLYTAPPAQVANRQRLTEAARDVLAERCRQIEREGWTPAHDDRHDEGDLALAAIVYAESAVGYHASCPDTWPWSPTWFKPATPRRDLVKAGALILAEIERIDRALLEGAKQ